MALQQREADFAGLMAELASLRRQMSSSAGPSRSSGGRRTLTMEQLWTQMGDYGDGRVVLMPPVVLRMRPTRPEVCLKIGGCRCKERDAGP